MKITINHQSPDPEYLTESTGNRPGIYIDRDNDIWLVSEDGTLMAVVSDDCVRPVVRSYSSDKIVHHQIRRMPDESSITLANNNRD